MNSREVSYESMDWIRLAQNSICWQAVLNMVMNFCLHNSEEFIDLTISYSRKLLYYELANEMSRHQQNEIFVWMVN
jgi:hypothetical protein